MSTKFEQLLDLIVNEEMDKANELFHEIVVEKSRDIYENLIAEEAEEEEMEEAADEEAEESVDEAAEDDEEEMDESADEEADESVDLEDSYSMEADDEAGAMGGDATDDFGADVGAMDDEEGGEAGEDAAIFDIKNAIEELEAAFAKLEQAQGGEEPHGEFGDEEGGEEDDMEMMGQPAFEGRRMTREYTENVGTNWEKGATQKAQGQYAGAGTGDKVGAPVEGKSPISSGSGKPNSGANAKNLAQGQAEGQSNTGTSPGKVNNGITKTAGEKFASGIHNVDGKKSGVKTLGKVAGGHGAEKKGAGPGPVGSGTGDKAGQTSVAKIPTFLKKL
jgi:hypothetical protein